jgi:hypothetical protein
VASGDDNRKAISFIETSFKYYSAICNIPEYHHLFNGDWLFQKYMGRGSLLTEIALTEMAERESTLDKPHEGTDLLAHFYKAMEANPTKMTKKDVFSIAHGALYVSIHLLEVHAI